MSNNRKAHEAREIERRVVEGLSVSEKRAVDELRSRILSDLTDEERAITDNTGYVIW